MALADIKQRPGTVLGVAVVLHLVLISAQVNTATGIPIDMGTICQVSISMFHWLPAGPHAAAVTPKPRTS